MSDCGERCSWKPVAVAPPRLLFSSDGSMTIDPDPTPGAGPGPEILDPTPKEPAPAPAPPSMFARLLVAAGVAVVGLVAAVVIGGTVGPFVGAVLVIAGAVVAAVELVKELADVGPAPAVQGIGEALGALARGDVSGAAAALARVPILSWVWLVVLVLFVSRYLQRHTRGANGKN